VHPRPQQNGCGICGLVLHGPFRLVVQLVEDDLGVYVLIEEIVDYHRG